MKLTEAKLKQMILESMTSSGHYRKLLSLMDTEDGVVQAQSLFEMVQDILDPEEKEMMISHFDIINLAKEVRSLKQEAKDAKERYERLENKLIMSRGGITAEIEEAYHNQNQTQILANKKEEEFNERMSAMRQHCVPKVCDLARDIVEKKAQEIT